MDDQKKKDIMDSFRLINGLAGEATNAHRDLASHTRIVIDALNQLFVLNGLEGNENLFTKCAKCEKLLRYSYEVKLHVCETK